MGNLRPGNSPAEVKYDGNVSFGSTGQMVMELGGLQSGSQADKVDVTGALNLGGELTVVLYNGFTPSLGDRWDLFDASTTSGTFDSLSLPQLADGMQWDTSSLDTNGSITVVPEPSTLVLLLLGGLPMLCLRRRQTPSGVLR